MRVRVRHLCGVGSIPSGRTNAAKWLWRQGVSTALEPSEGGPCETIALSDLPEPERLAFLRQELDGMDLPAGEYDDDAHRQLGQASPSRRARAERRAGIARMLVALRVRGVKEGERFALVRERFGVEGTSNASLKRLQRAVQGVDPINFAPVLLDDYKAPAKRAEMSDEAWRFFMTMIRDAAPDWPLKEAWRRVRDAGRPMGWAVPSYPTFYRRWKELSEAQRLQARRGNGETAKRLSIPAHRDKTSILSLEWVSLDGRTLDFWVDWGDGKAARPVMLALVDVASNVVLDWELGPSENAVGTVRLIKRVCERHGIFDRLYTDNGSAFAGHLVAGGAAHRFRNGKAKGVQPMGICQIMGIKLRFALPKNAQAKIAERTFAALSRAVDDGPEFRNAHAGHAPGASPSPKVIPVPVETAKAVLTREIARHNRESGRRSQGARGRSYEQVFRDGIEVRAQEGRPTRRPTAQQLYLAGLIWKPVAVDRFGRVAVNGWLYGGPDTQDALLRFHGTGKRILLGRDPDDFSAPAMAYDEDGVFICRDIEPVKPGVYGSVDSIRDAARNRKAARAAVSAAEVANDYLDNEAYAEALAALNAATMPEDTPPAPVQKVVGGRFGTPLRSKAPRADQEKEIIPAEFLQNMDTELAAKRSRGGSSA